MLPYGHPGHKSNFSFPQSFLIPPSSILIASMVFALRILDIQMRYWYTVSVRNKKNIRLYLSYYWSLLVIVIIVIICNEFSFMTKLHVSCNLLD